MSRVLTFARYFPAYHPKAGQPTHFVEKLWAGWLKIGLIGDDIVVKEEEPGKK